MRYKVVIRDEIPNIKPEAAKINGKVFEFTDGWKMDESDTSIYIGETAMIPNDKNYPISAPSWLASGDLQKEDCEQ